MTKFLPAITTLLAAASLSACSDNPAGGAVGALPGTGGRQEDTSSSILADGGIVSGAFGPALTSTAALALTLPGAACPAEATQAISDTAPPVSLGRDPVMDDICSMTLDSTVLPGTPAHLVVAFHGASVLGDPIRGMILRDTAFEAGKKSSSGGKLMSPLLSPRDTEMLVWACAYRRGAEQATTTPAE